MRMDDIVAEKCGVTGVRFSDSRDAVQYVHQAQLYLGHRGQDAFRFASYDGEFRRMDPQRGTVPVEFPEEARGLRGSVAIGHNRYMTAGAHGSEYAHPFEERNFVLAHNGTIGNASALAREMIDGGVVFSTGRTAQGTDPNLVSDTEVLAKLIASRRDVVDGLQYASTRALGSYSLTLIDRDGALYGVRDPYGRKPLGKARGNKSFGVFSESRAVEAPLLQDEGMEWMGDIEPGTIYRVGRDGEATIDLPGKGVRRKLDILEYVYFLHPSSVVDGVSISRFRWQAGVHMADLVDVDRDMAVVAIPQSGVSYAQGFAAATQLPMVEWIYRNHHAHRVFIAPTPAARKRMARLKFTINEAEVRAHPRAYLFDDSVIRGDTSRALILPLRQAGAEYMYFMSAFEPVRFACMTGGIYLPDPRDHLANQHPDHDARARFLGVDKLTYNKYPSLVGALNIVREPGTQEFSLADFCTQCFTGEDPLISE